MRLRCNPRTALGCIAAGFLTALGCSGARPDSEASTPAAAVGEPWVVICPPVVGGADVAVERADSRVGLVLTAAPALAGDVVERVRQLGSALAVRGDETFGSKRVNVSAIEGGARLTIEVPEGADAALVAQAVTAMLRRMHSGGCPPMPERPRSEPSTPPEAQPPVGHHH